VYAACRNERNECHYFSADSCLLAIVARYLVLLYIVRVFNTGLNTGGVNKHQLLYDLFFAGGVMRFAQTTGRAACRSGRPRPCLIDPRLRAHSSKFHIGYSISPTRRM